MQAQKRACKTGGVSPARSMKDVHHGTVSVLDTVYRTRASRSIPVRPVMPGRFFGGAGGGHPADRPDGGDAERIPHQTGVCHLSLRRHGEGCAEKKRPHLQRHRQRIHYRCRWHHRQLQHPLRRGWIQAGSVGRWPDGHLVHRAMEQTSRSWRPTWRSTTPLPTA